MIVLTVNGIWSNGADSVDRLHAPLRALGHTVIDVKQPVRSVWDVRSAKKREKDAMTVVDLAWKHGADAVVAHSYGGIKSALAMKHYPFKMAYLFRPAMTTKWIFPEYTHITCVHSKGDWPVFFGGLLIGHEFGWAGRNGFKDPNVRNIRTRGHHSSDFDHDRPDDWANHIHFNYQRLG
jgi:hypothetical protein